MKCRSFPFSVFQLCSAFIALRYPVASATDPDQWFLNCAEFFNCKTISTTEFHFWRNESTESCSPAEKIRLKCEGRGSTIEFAGVEFDLVGFNTKDQIFLIAETHFSSRFCSHGSSSFVYGVIPVSEICGQPDRAATTCSESESRLGYWALQNHTNGADADPTDCRVSLLVYISAELLQEVGGLQRAHQRIREKFETLEPKVDGGVCTNCRDLGGICGYELLYERMSCFCISSSNRFVFCPTAGTLQQYHSFESDKSVLLKKILIIEVAFASCCILIIIILLIYIHNTRKRISKSYDVEEIMRRYSTQTPKQFSYSKLKKVTNSFQNKLGQGGFSTVYKGKLPSGQDVAVKLLNETKEDGQNFMNEVINITRTSHINIASLLGFCFEYKKRALIYEYMPRGSLDKYISQKGSQENEIKLELSTLYNIVVGIARGLEYLHCGCNTRIVHFDIKPHNVLLDNEFCPKISDFGLAKQCKARESHVSMTGMKGTIGFMAPEIMFRNFGKVSHKSDVYSFGMLVLTMMGERKSFDEGVEQSSQEHCFPVWMYNDLTQSEIDQICWWGHKVEDEEMGRKMIIVGLCCIQTLPEERPSMSEVVAMLEGSVDGLQIPPKPTLFRPPVLPQPSSSSIL